MRNRRPLPAGPRTLLVTVAVTIAALVASAAGIASRSAPPGAARDLALAFFAPGLTRAEVVTIVGRVEHDYRIDEGRIVAVRPNAIDLLERDGTRQTIPLASPGQTPGRVFGPTVFVRGTRVVTLRENGGPATQIRPSNQARILGRALFGPALVRAEVLVYQAKTPHDYRIDQGRVVSVKPNSSITLFERDGTRQTISTDPTTIVTEGGQVVDQTAIAKGMTAITIREGDGPAEQILLVPGVLVVRP
jgi:hypothetical protein